MDEPPRYTRSDEPPGDEPFPQFESGISAESPLPIQRAAGARPYRGGGGQTNPWLIGVAVAAVLGAISIIAFGLLSPQDETGTTGAPATTDASGTTAPDDDTATTDGTATTVTTVTLPDPADLTIEPTGDPIPVTDLQMSAVGLGTLDFGDNSMEVLGKLAATFGDPTQDTGFFVGSGSWGECAGEAIRVVQWGPLNIVSRGEAAGAEFISYRLNLKYGGLTSDTTDIQTLSGLRVGDTVGQLKEVYANFNLQFVVDPDDGLVFELREAPTADVLLWGPVDSQDDDATVTGIYSPNSCDR